MRKIIPLILVICLFASFMPVTASSEGNFGVNLGSDAYNSANRFAWGQCTWYAWGRAYEKGTCLSWTNVVTGDGFGDAWTWYENARAAGYSCGTEPRANSVAVDTNPSDHGHVMFVEAIDEDIMWVTEANIKGVEYTEGYYNLSTGAYTNTYGNVSFAGGSATWNGRPMPSGYIYLDDLHLGAESADVSSDAQNTPIVEYLCQIPTSSFERYEDNEGDSCIFNFDKQGLPGNDNEYIRNGNIGVNGEEYENGFEVWLARWNGSEEISWVKATYPLNGQYSRLTGITGLIKSYNTTRFDTAVCFYAGDKLLKLYILTPDYYNWDIDVDLTGVQNLTILVKDNMAVNGGTSFALADLRLTPADSAQDLYTAPLGVSASKPAAMTNPIVGRWYSPFNSGVDYSAYWEFFDDGTYRNIFEWTENGRIETDYTEDQYLLWEKIDNNVYQVQYNGQAAGLKPVIFKEKYLYDSSDDTLHRLYDNGNIDDNYCTRYYGEFEVAINPNYRSTGQ